MFTLAPIVCLQESTWQKIKNTVTGHKVGLCNACIMVRLATIYTIMGERLLRPCKATKPSC